MFVSRLALDHYRSWESLVVDLEPGVNILHGENGLGKTNIVEALEVLSTGTSHRTSSSLPLIARGETRAVVRANIVEPDAAASPSGPDPAASEDADDAAGNPKAPDGTLPRNAQADVQAPQRSRVTTLEATIMARGANRARVNSGPSRYLRDIVGLVPSVSFTPEDQRLVSADPAVRRTFLDQAGALLVPRYGERLAQFTRIARQRAALLKQLGQHEGSVDAALSGLEIWTGQFIEAGVDLTRVRAQMTERLAQPFARIYGRLASGHGEAALRYAPSFAEVLDARGGQGDPRPAIAAHFQRLYAGEVSRGVNLIGPQRDDLTLMLDGMPARDFASNGEMWTLALALKMALYEITADDRGVKPIVILDDVFAQLDERRRGQILDFASAQDQVLVTAAAAGDIPGGLGAGGADGSYVSNVSDGAAKARATIIDVAALRAACDERDAAASAQGTDAA